jgi:uncharacterized protein with GYD domain
LPDAGGGAEARRFGGPRFAARSIGHQNHEEVGMPKYLWKGNYSPQGVKGLLKEGGTAREKAVRELLEGIGGKLDAYYYALGDHDAYCIIDVPDNATATAVSLAIAAAGITKVQTIALLTSAEVDQAVKKPVRYRPPGA